MKNMKQCMNPHIYMHSLFGVGVGFILADIWSGLAMWWLGLILMVVATVFHPMKKS